MLVASDEHQQLAECHLTPRQTSLSRVGCSTAADWHLITWISTGNPLLVNFQSLECVGTAEGSWFNTALNNFPENRRSLNSIYSFLYSRKSSILIEWQVFQCLCEVPSCHPSAKSNGKWNEAKMKLSALVSQSIILSWNIDCLIFVEAYSKWSFHELFYSFLSIPNDIRIRILLQIFSNRSSMYVVWNSKVLDNSSNDIQTRVYIYVLWELYKNMILASI